LIWFKAASVEVFEYIIGFDRDRNLEVSGPKTVSDGFNAFLLLELVPMQGGVNTIEIVEPIKKKREG
jgi:hypothetical protein